VVDQLIELGGAAGVVRREEAFGSLLEHGSRVGGVRTTAGTEISADAVVVCAGAWTPTLLPWLSDRLHAVAQPVLLFGVSDPTAFSGASFPPWTADIAGSGWYGFPALADGRLKVGHHGPGVPIHPDARGEVSREHVSRARAFLGEALPALARAPLVEQRVCLYCDSPDGDFLIDVDPDREGLVVASGGSGHAFKFAPMLGALVADAVEGRSNPWAGRFRWRPGSGELAEAARFQGR
jgi:sarcosine oxidase / L-pipecolate oxidase